MIVMVIIEVVVDMEIPIPLITKGIISVMMTPSKPAFKASVEY